jgi:hypothetical protein
VPEASGVPLAGTKGSNHPSSGGESPSRPRNKEHEAGGDQKVDRQRLGGGRSEGHTS